jgi:redox-sensitive bicupin YhaK (pirin superfamily)
MQLRISRMRTGGGLAFLSARTPQRFGTARHVASKKSDDYDPRWMGFCRLRMINDDLVMPGMGFGSHPHRDLCRP